MLVVTNRKIKTGKKNLEVFGDEPNAKGPNELRVVDIDLESGKDGDYEVTVLPDQITKARIAEILKENKLEHLEVSSPQPGSFQAACQIFGRALEQKKSILFFVHGYNNDMAAVIKSVRNLEALYNVVVLPFSWPANGGGFTKGTLKYRDDKADARVSMGALNRFIEKIGELHKLMIHRTITQAEKVADDEFPNRDDARWGAIYTQYILDNCTVKLNLLCHSMGNYLLKYALKPESSAAAGLVFDNVALVAADANNEKHEEWVKRLQVRNRTYVVINEHDKALAASRVKFGGEQKARLGHYIGNLNADNARYIDVTYADGVKTDHSYFVGEPVAKNAALKSMFNTMFTGGQAERGLRHRPDTKTYSLQEKDELPFDEIG